MQDIHYIDSQFQTHIQNKLALSISIRRDGFAFLILDKDLHKIIATQYTNTQHPFLESDYMSSLENFLQQDFLQNQFDSVSIIYVSNKTTIIPASLFNIEQLPLLYSTNQILEENETVYHYKSKNVESYLVYSIPNSIYSVCKTAMPTCEFFPQSAPILEFSILQNKPLSSKCVYISVENSYFDIIVLDGPKLMLSNSFEYTNLNDFIYYIMNVFEQLQLPATNTPTVVLGKISKASNYYTSLQMFIKNISIVVPLSSQQYLTEYPFNNASFPLFSAISNLSLCE